MDISKSFRRNVDGSWTCVEQAMIDGPHCPIEVAPGSTFAPGTKVEGLDVAQWIEDHASRQVWRELAGKPENERKPR